MFIGGLQVNVNAGSSNTVTVTGTGSVVSVTGGLSLGVGLGATSSWNTLIISNGATARSAFGVAQIPLGACVEIELIAELD